MKLPASLLARTTLIVLVSMALAGVLFIQIITPMVADRIQQQSTQRLGVMLDTLENTVSIACFTEDRKLAAELADGLLKNPEIAAVVITGTFTDLARRDRPGATLGATLQRPINSPFIRGDLVGEITLTLDATALQQRIHQDLGYAARLLVLQLLVLGILGAAIVALLIVHPIKRMSDHLHGMDAGSGIRLATPRLHQGDELGRLVDDINRLADRLVASLHEEQEIRRRSQEGERKYHAIFDHAEAGIFITDTQGRIDSHNAAFLDLTGLAADTGPLPPLPQLTWRDPAAIRAAIQLAAGQALGVDGENRTRQTHLSPDSPAHSTAMGQETGNKGTDTATDSPDPIATGANPGPPHTAGDFELLREAEQARWLHLVLTAIGNGRLQGVLTDVTVLRRALESTESASKAKSAFLASMSHELRTPLNAIIGFAQLLDMGAIKPLDPELRESVGHILNSGRHLLGLVNEILDLARIESGHLKLVITAVAAETMIEEAINLTRPLATEHRVSLHHSRGAGVFVLADAARLRQILLNLLSNAVKYNHPDGMVDISCRPFGDMARIAVVDTGRGIPLTRQSAAFQPFQRLGAERSNIEGSGVGLVVAKQLAEAMNGRMNFESEVGLGSRFWIDLPLDRQTTTLHRPPDQPPVQIGSDSRGRVLYVEDNNANAAIMRHVFRLLPDAELLEAETAEIGLALAREQRPDLILMDINLPGMNGVEALRVLQADARTAHIPVLAVTAAAMPEEVTSGQAAGFRDYVTKPFDIPTVVERIRHHLPNPKRIVR